jgi:hypothetical protein
VTSDALDPFMVEPEEKQSPEPLPYLNESMHYVYDIVLDTYLNNDNLEEPFLISSSNAKVNLSCLFWTIRSLFCSTCIGALLSNLHIIQSLDVMQDLEIC